MPSTSHAAPPVQELPSPPVAVFRDRIARAHRALTESDTPVDAFIVSNPPDIRWLTGFHGDASHAVLSVSGLSLYSDSRFEQELRELASFTTPHVQPNRSDRYRAIPEELHRVDASRVGFQAEHLTHALHARFASHATGLELVPTQGALTRLRAIKDEHEIAAIRAAVGIQQAALLSTLKTVKAGQTERVICARLEYEMQLRGSEGSAFGPIVAAGANAALPHASPGPSKTTAHGLLLIDWGSVACGYRSDMTRTFGLGGWPGEMAEVYEIVREAFEAGAAALKPGASTGAVDQAARAVIERSGYGSRFTHSLGHGIGLDIHESPWLRAKGPDTLKPGMIVTIEPGIYLPGIGGVRLEDDFLVTETGAENLSTLPKTLEWATQ